MGQQNPEQTQPPEAQKNQPQGDVKDVQENKLVAILSYVGILFLIPLLLKKDSKFTQFHAKQGMLVFLGEIVGFLTTPMFGLGVLINLAMIILSIIGISNVLSGKTKKLPLLGDWADKFNI